MKRYVIYSALVGDYDNILQPSVIDDRFDFVLFSNDIPEPRAGVWQIRPIEYHNDDSTRICRYVKTHPETMLSDYPVSVWMDSNVQILDDFIYNRIIELDTKEVLLSSMWHPTRRCIYDEAFAVVNMMVEHEGVVIDWCHYLRKRKYPKDNGLYETNVLYRKHSERIVREIDTLWWDSINSYSRRDQLSLNYSIWEKGVPCQYLFGEGLNARNTQHLRVITHRDTGHNHCPVGRNEAWLMRHCWKKTEDTDVVRRLYYRFYAWPLPHVWIALVGQYYRIKDRLS